MFSTGSSKPYNLSSFVHTTPISTILHDPFISLASHCIRLAFGPTVQLVADCLQTRGDLNLKQIIRYCRTPSVNPSIASIRASLLVLIQHSIVTTSLPSKSSPAIYHYDPNEALYIIRYAKYVEYAKKALDPTAACLVETLLLAGRLRTVDLLLQAAEVAPKSDRYTMRQSVVAAMSKLVQGCYLKQVPQLSSVEEQEEFEMDDERPKKKVKLEIPENAQADHGAEDPVIVTLIQSHAHYKTTLPIDAVWCVNIPFFHECLRAFHVGKLVAEAYGNKVQSAGSLVTAALKFITIRKYTAKQQGAADELLGGMFSSQDSVKYLPKPVLQLLEQKVGGVTMNLSKSWKELASFTHPTVVRRVADDSYEIALTSLTDYIKDRIVHQIVHDRHGEVAARTVRILCIQGWLEADSLADQAMVPAKDAREILHRLYRSQYIDLFPLSTSRQHNPASAIYLWCVHRDRLLRKIGQDVMTALWNVRLRRQHEVEVGRQWIERAQQASDMDENVHEEDKVNYTKFCQGLERLDCAMIQLDETLMALRDF